MMVIRCHAVSNARPKSITLETALADGPKIGNCDLAFSVGSDSVFGHVGEAFF
jgi:hypothetical protein